ncbi:MAG: hypothetical protein ACKODH_07565 [Limisphaerales bacterium]
MITRPFDLLLGSVLLVAGGCKQRDSPAPSGPPPPPEFGSSENNLGYLNEGVRNFQQTKGRRPNDLNELVTDKVIARIPPPPPGFTYVMDRGSGLVTLQPGGPAK